MKTFLKRYNFISNKSFYKAYASLAVPIVLQQIITSAAQTIDSLMVGVLGSKAIAAVGATNEIFFTLLVAILGISGAAQIFISQFLGAKDDHSVTMVFNLTLMVSLIASIIGFFVINIFSTQLLGFFISDSVTMALAKQFLHLISFSFIIFSLSAICGGSFSAFHMPKIAMYAGIIAVLTNTALNYLLINGNLGCPKLGVSGAGYATCTARCVEFAVYIIAIKINDSPIKINPYIIKELSSKFLKKFAKTAIPLLCNETTWSFLQTVLVIIYVASSSDNTSALTMAKNYKNLIFVFFSGLATATSVMMGKSLGENNFEKAKKQANTFYFTAASIAVVLCVLANIFVFLIPALYPHVDDNVLKTTILLVRIYSFTIIFDAINGSSFFMLRSGGDIRSVIIIDVICTLVITIPVAFVLRYILKVSFVDTFLITLIVDGAKVFISVPLVKSGKWIRNIAT